MSFFLYQIRNLPKILKNGPIRINIKFSTKTGREWKFVLTQILSKVMKLISLNNKRLKLENSIEIYNFYLMMVHIFRLIISSHFIFSKILWKFFLLFPSQIFITHNLRLWSSTLVLFGWSFLNNITKTLLRKVTL